MTNPYNHLVDYSTYCGLSPMCRKIVNYMARMKDLSISGDEAHQYLQCKALPRRMSDLREAGVAIRKEYRKHRATGQRYVRYFLEEPEHNPMPLVPGLTSGDVATL